MDMIAGAGELEWRIACQTHWRQAAAVRDGRQSACDPDGDRLQELGDGVRLYQPQAVERRRDGLSWVVYEQVRKHLADGWWHAATVELPPGTALGEPL
jgi:hypothetical protein